MNTRTILKSLAAAGLIAGSSLAQAAWIGADFSERLFFSGLEKSAAVSRPAIDFNAGGNAELSEPAGDVFSNPFGLVGSVTIDVQTGTITFSAVPFLNGYVYDNVLLSITNLVFDDPNERLVIRGISVDSLVAGQFDRFLTPDPLLDAELDNAAGFTLEYLANQGTFMDMNDGSVTLEYEIVRVGAAVPEPASAALVGLGLLGLGAMRRRKQA